MELLLVQVNGHAGEVLGVVRAVQANARGGPQHDAAENLLGTSPMVCHSRRVNGPDKVVSRVGDFMSPKPPSQTMRRLARRARTRRSRPRRAGVTHLLLAALVTRSLDARLTLLRVAVEEGVVVMAGRAARAAHDHAVSLSLDAIGSNANANRRVPWTGTHGTGRTDRRGPASGSSSRQDGGAVHDHGRRRKEGGIGLLRAEMSGCVASVRCRDG
ncbi:hypothetical protein HYQ46_007001 [Verticillium longisporum]|nr:hypothetical protein HYQ46_007001 [Verticillium longisporum]